MFTLSKGKCTPLCKNQLVEVSVSDTATIEVKSAAQIKLEPDDQVPNNMGSQRKVFFYEPQFRRLNNA